MVNNKTWEERIAYAKKVNAQKNSAGVNNAPAVNAVTVSGQTKSWDDRIANAKKINAAKRAAENQRIINSAEYKWASENEKRLKSGLGYNVNNGQIYSFEPVTKDSLQKSIAWADSEIEKLKEQGGHSTKVGEWTDKILTYAGYGDKSKDRISEADEIEEASIRLRELEGQRAVYKKYLENAEYEEAMAEIKKNGDGELFNELFAIDSRKDTLLDALSNIGSSGSILPSGNVGDIGREAQLKAELLAKYGENFNKYRELYAKGTNDEFKASLVEKMEETIEEHPVLGTIGYTLGNVFSSPVRGIGVLSDAINKASGNYGASSGSVFQNMSEATVQRVNEDINEKFKNPHAAGFVRTLYNAAVSGAESMMSMGTFGKFGEAILGLNAATSTYNSAKERGLSDGQAIMNGIAAGVFEALFEHISLDKLRAFQSSPSTSLKPFILNVLKQAGVEGSEELLTDISNEAYDYLVNGGLSQYKQALQNGMTPEEYSIQFGLQLVETFATGALSGAGMVGVTGAPSAVKGSIASSNVSKTIGEYIRENDKVNEVLKDAKKQGGIIGIKAANIEKRLSNNKSVSDKAIGKIDRNIRKQQRATAIDEILSSDEYKNLSDKERKAIRSSVLTHFSSAGQVAPEQSAVLETENGQKVLQALYDWQNNKAIEEAENIAENKKNKIRTAVAEGNTEQLVKNTFEAKNTDGHTVEVGAVRSVENGELEIVQDKSSGATAKLSELKISDKDAAELYAELQKAATGNNAMSVDSLNIALSMYSRYENKSAESYIAWAHDAYKAGMLKKDNTVLSFAEFEKMFEGSYSGDITREQLYQMYEAGARNLETTPGVTLIGARGLTKNQTEQVFIINQLAKKSGTQVVIINGKLSDNDGRGINGLYKSGTNRIVLSLQGAYNLVLVHAGHEMFHYAKSLNGDWGMYLQNMVINVLKSDSKYDFDGIYKQVSEDYEGLSEDEILEEIAAQYLGVALSNEATIKKIVNEADTKERTFLQNLIEHLKQFISDIKALLDIYGSKDKTVKAAVETPLSQLEYIADEFMRALTEAGKNKKPTVSDGGVKYSKQKPKKNSAKNKKSYYNETATILMIWANSKSTPIGEMLCLKSKGKPVCYKKTETGYILISKTEYKEKEQNYAEIIDGKRNENGKTDSGLSSNTTRGSYIDVSLDGDRGNARRDNKGASEVEEKRTVPGYSSDTESDRRHNREIFSSRQFKGDNGRSDIKSSGQFISDADTKKKFSKQLRAETEAGIEQISVENESLGEYIDRVCIEIEDKIGDKRTPGEAKGYGRDAFIDIAREYNAYNYNERGSIRSRYSNNEIAVNIERVLVGISDGILSAKDGLTILADIQEDILLDGYDIEDTSLNIAFRKELKNKPIFVSENIYNELLERYGGKKKLRAASFNQLSIKPADDVHKENIKDIYAYLQKEYSELLLGASSEIGMIEDLIVTEREVRPKVSYYSKEYKFGGEMDIKEAATRRAAEMLQKAFEVELVDIDVGLQYHQLLAAKRSLEDRKRFYKETLSKAADISYRRDQKQRTYNRVIRNTKRLDKLLREETDTNHIPENLKHSVAQLLSIIVPNANNSRGKSEINSVLSLDELQTAYSMYEFENNSSYTDDVLNMLKELKYIFADGRNIRQLSAEELTGLDTIIEHFSFLVRRGNEMFINGRREIFSKWANESTRQMYRHAHKPEYKTQMKILDAEYGMLTPIYFFKAIGTTTEKGEYVQEERLFSMFRDLQKGQDKWYRNIERTRNDLAEIKKKYHYSDSWKRDTREFTLTSGEKIKLTAEEIMYMRALYIREGKHINNLNHLLEGGIVIENDGKLKGLAEKMAAMKEIQEARKKFKKNKESEKTYTRDDISERLKKNLTAEDLKVIFAALTEDMEGYSEAIVNMLSTTGAELGNKVSMELFGIKKFTEKNYMPISVVSDFIATTIEKRNADTAKLKNRSFTKRTTRNANAAVYVRSITDIAAEHMHEMCLYNAMTVPIENITRVFNYQLPDNEYFDDEGKRIRETGNSFKEIFEAVYGKRGKEYFENFLRDMNGGNQTPARDFTSRMLGAFKKSAVMGSLSVAIQQLSAVVRACALVDAKYFVIKLYNSADYAEMLKYCPVAGIKEIGRFDTGLGSTATEWILNDKNGFFDMAENVLSFLPGMMDRMIWVHIWNAVKRETRANNKDLTGEALLERAAERFRDVIDYTQVYDSTLSRSEFMRDQGTVAKMATSFMAEPTLTYNLLRDAARNAGNDKKQAVKSVAAFVGATLLNAFLKSFVTALRKDDEETNYFEVYVSDFISNFFGDLNPLGMIPVIKDVMSIVEGYDVKRLDMSLFESLINSAKVITSKLSKGKIPTFEECFTLVGTATAFTGVPLSNVFRDFMAAISTLQGIGKSPDFSLREALASEKTSDAVKLYRAIIAGDENAVNRYKIADAESVKEYISQGYSETDAILKATDNAENNFHTKVIDGLISEDIRIKEAAEARLISDVKIYEELLEELTGLGFDRNDVVQAVDKYIKSLEEKTYKQSETKDKAIYTYDDLFSAINTDKMTSAKHIFDKLSENVSKETVQENIRDEYAEAIYEAILNNNKTEKQRLEKIFEEFNYDYHYAVILGLRENDERISEAAEARYKGDIQEYESIKAELLSDGFDENDIFNAIETETEKLAPDEEKEESHPESSYLYEPADLKRYADSFNLSATKRAIQNFRDSGKEDGDIRKTLTGVFKKKYIEAWKSGDDALIVTIRDFLEKCNIGYTNKTFSSWEKEAIEN